MADEPSTEQVEEKATTRRTSKAEPPAQPQQQDAGDVEQGGSPPDVPVSQLIESSTAFLGYPSHVAAGALAGHEGDEMMSADAAKSEIEAWLDKPVEVDGEGEEE